MYHLCHAIFATGRFFLWLSKSLEVSSNAVREGKEHSAAPNAPFQTALFTLFVPITTGN